MLLLLALLGCTDVETPAIQACEAVPTISIDPQGLEILEPLLVESEIELLRQAEPTRGLMAVKHEGMHQLRSAASCQVVEVRKETSGRWLVRLRRTLPAVKLEGGFGDPVVQDLEWRVVKRKDGVRVETGLQRMVSMRESVAEELARNNFSRVTDLWRSIAGIYGDPLLVYDISDAAMASELWSYRTKLLRAGVVGKDEETEELVIRIENIGPKDVRDATILMVYEQGEGDEKTERIERRQTQRIPASSTVELREPIPEDEDTTVRIEIITVAL